MYCTPANDGFLYWEGKKIKMIEGHWNLFYGKTETVTAFFTQQNAYDYAIQQHYDMNLVFVIYCPRPLPRVRSSRFGSGFGTGSTTTPQLNPLPPFKPLFGSNPSRLFDNAVPLFGENPPGNFGHAVPDGFFTREKHVGPQITSTTPFTFPDDANYPSHAVNPTHLEMTVEAQVPVFMAVMKNQRNNPGGMFIEVGPNVMILYVAMYKERLLEQVKVHFPFLRQISENSWMVFDSEEDTEVPNDPAEKPIVYVFKVNGV